MGTGNANGLTIGGNGMRIRISPNGENVTTVHKDEFGYENLGKTIIHRVSDINYNNLTGEWDVYIRPTRLFLCVDGTLSRHRSWGFQTKHEALSAEVIFLESDLHTNMPEKGWEPIGCLS